MTFLHHSTRVLRRIVARSQSKGKRSYTQLSPPVFKVPQTEPSVEVIGRPKTGEGWAIPLAVALLGLAFSTFSTHQLMTCTDGRVKAFTADQPPDANK